MKSFWLLICLSLCAISANGDDKKVLLAGIEMTPYSGAHLPNQGVVVDLVRKAFALEGWTLEIDFYPVARATRMQTAGSVHGYLLATVNFQVPSSLYSDPIIRGDIAFFSLQSKVLPYQSPNDLADERVGSMAGWGAENMFTSLTWQTVSSPEQLFKMLRAGRISAFIYETNAFAYLVNKYDAGHQHRYKTLEPMVTPVEYGVSFAADHPRSADMVVALNSGLAKLRAIGYMAKLAGELNIRLE